MRQFDPEKDKGKPLFELQTNETPEGFVTSIVPSAVEFEIAAQTPWYYVVEDK